MTQVFTVELLVTEALDGTTRAPAFSPDGTEPNSVEPDDDQIWR